MRSLQESCSVCVERERHTERETHRETGCHLSFCKVDDWELIFRFCFSLVPRLVAVTCGCGNAATSGCWGFPASAGDFWGELRPWRRGFECSWWSGAR